MQGFQLCSSLSLPTHLESALITAMLISIHLVIISGRAAQRLQEVVDHPEVQAKTIHRLLGYKGQGGGSGKDQDAAAAAEQSSAASSSSPQGGQGKGVASSSLSTNTGVSSFATDDGTSHDEISQV